GEAVARNTEAGMERLEAARAEKRVAQDEQRPAIADDGQRACDRTVELADILPAHTILSLPGFAERADLDVEGPRRARLVHDVPDLLGDVGRFDEELVGLVAAQPARPFQIDDRVDDDIRDMHALRTEKARH